MELINKACFFGYSSTDWISSENQFSEGLVRHAMFADAHHSRRNENTILDFSHRDIAFVLVHDAIVMSEGEHEPTSIGVIINHSNLTSELITVTIGSLKHCAIKF